MTPSDCLNVQRTRRKEDCFIVIAVIINTCRLCQNGDTNRNIVYLSNGIAKYI